MNKTTTKAPLTFNLTAQVNGLTITIEPQGLDGWSVTTTADSPDGDDVIDHQAGFSTLSEAKRYAETFNR